MNTQASTNKLPTSEACSTVGVVIIGRNEGARLIACLESLTDFFQHVVYVDSDSTDNSLTEVKKRGAHVVSLDMTQPFTAARARNTGFDTILSLYPNIKFVQFVDGDCIVNSNWIKTAADFLNNNSNIAVVCGRRREIFPLRSIYNQMCDQEWNTPIGEAKACGGDALMRADVIKLVGGYRNNLIAGEEPELCIRIRQAGYLVWRIDAEMTLHDAAMIRFSQWWKRTMRAGYAYAEGVSIHGAYPERHWVKESIRAWVWGFILPSLILIMSLVDFNFSLLVLAYPLQILKLALKDSHQKKWQNAFFLVIGKFAEMLGQLKFFKQKYLNEKISLIEYK
jgi:glycosyltransferase involved in cell wall biosynthesis